MKLIIQNTGTNSSLEGSLRDFKYKSSPNIILQVSFILTSFLGKNNPSERATVKKKYYIKLPGNRHLRTYSRPTAFCM